MIIGKTSLTTNKHLHLKKVIAFVKASSPLEYISVKIADKIKSTSINICQVENDHHVSTIIICFSLWRLMSNNYQYYMIKCHRRAIISGYFR